MTDRTIHLDLSGIQKKWACSVTTAKQISQEAWSEGAHFDRCLLKGVFLTNHDQTFNLQQMTGQHKRDPIPLKCEKCTQRSVDVKSYCKT